MAGGHSFRIELLGTSLTIRSREDQAYFNRILWYLEKKVEETKQRTNIVDPIKIAILTNVYIIDELLREKSRNGRDSPLDGESEEMERLTLRMISEIDDVIGK